MLTDQKTSKISIIIPVLNEAEHLEKTLSGLIAQPGVEVIVVDGGSVDGTVDIAGKAGIKVLKTPPGRGRQMNVGAKVATGSILLFLHGDTLLPAGFERYVRNVLAETGVVAGAFRLAIDSPAKKLRVVERFTNLRANLLQLPYGDQAIFLQAARFWSVGGFQDIPLMEDFALVRTLRRQGRIKILPHAVVTSARRWQRLGVMRTTCIHQIIILGYLLGVSPVRLASSWHRQRKDV